MTTEQYELLKSRLELFEHHQQAIISYTNDIAKIDKCCDKGITLDFIGWTARLGLCPTDSHVLREWLIDLFKRRIAEHQDCIAGIRV